MAGSSKAAAEKPKKKRRKKAADDGQGGEEGPKKEHHGHDPEHDRDLYEQGELLLRKHFQERERQKALEAEEEARECTFAPQINKGPIKALQKPQTPEWKRRRERAKKQSLAKQEAEKKQSRAQAKSKSTAHHKKAYAVVEFDGASNGSKRRIREVFAAEQGEEGGESSKKEKEKKKKKKRRKQALPKGLTFQVGDLVTVTTQGLGTGGTWCKGTFKGKEGVFPATCVDLAGEHRLYFQGLDALKKRDKAAEKHAEELDMECTFSPTLRAETPEQVRWRRRQQARQKRRRAERLRRRERDRERRNRDRRALESGSGDRDEVELDELDEQELCKLVEWILHVPTLSTSLC